MAAFDLIMRMYILRFCKSVSRVRCSLFFTALQQSLLSPSSQAYIWTILSREAIVQLGNSFFPNLAVLQKVLKW